MVWCDEWNGSVPILAWYDWVGGARDGINDEVMILLNLGDFIRFFDIVLFLSLEAAWLALFCLASSSGSNI